MSMSLGLAPGRNPTQHASLPSNPSLVQNTLQTKVNAKNAPDTPSGKHKTQLQHHQFDPTVANRQQQKMANASHCHKPPSTSALCQGASKTGSICNVRVPAELQCIYKGPLKGNGSLLNA